MSPFSNLLKQNKTKGLVYFCSYEIFDNEKIGCMVQLELQWYLITLALKSHEYPEPM